MRRPLLVVLAVVIFLTGLLWTLQGLGYVGGSPMTGRSVWAVVGPIVAGFGVALGIVAARGPR